MGETTSPGSWSSLLCFRSPTSFIELWSAGLLPVVGGEGRSVVEAYRRGAPRRLSEQGRVALYARCFGVPGGDPAEEPNRQFDELWLRFVRSVSAYARQPLSGGNQDASRYPYQPIKTYVSSANTDGAAGLRLWWSQRVGSSC